MADNNSTPCREWIESVLLGKRLVMDSGCWHWTGYRARTGYGGFHPYAHTYYHAHRLAAYVWLGLDLSDTKTLALHKCNNRICFNPDHLYLGSYKDNKRDSIEAGTSYTPSRGYRKESFKCGHPYTDGNFRYGTPSSKTAHRTRRCKICQDAYDHKRRHPQG